MSRARTASPWSGCARSANRRRPAVRRTTSSARSSSATSPSRSSSSGAATASALQLLACGGADVPGPQVDELGEPRPGLERAAPAPDAAVLGEQPAVDPVARELADEQGVAARQLPDRTGGRAGDRGAEARGEQRLDVVACQRAQLEHGAQLVLPQRAHGVRHRRPLPHGDERERLAGSHELVDERGRGAVEQLPVVDAQDQPAPGRALASASRACASRSAPPGSAAAGSSGANAPSGSEAAERVARTHATSASARSAAAAASRVLPTPAGPVTTTPPAEPPASASATNASSAPRPASGHRMRGV